MARMVNADDLFEVMNQIGAFSVLKDKRKELFTSAWGVPIVEAEPVKRGKWEKAPKTRETMELIGTSDGCRCSYCGNIERIESNYCPRCGAKMW